MAQLPLQNPLAPRTWMQSYGDASQLSHQLEAERTANALSQNTLNYAPQMSQAEIGEKNARAYENMGRGTNYFEEAKVHPSQIRLNDANASEAPYRNALLSQQAKYIPLKYQQEERRNEYLNNRFDNRQKLMQFVKTLPEAQRAQWLHDNPDAYDYLMANTGNLAINDTQNKLNDAQIPSAPTNAPQNALNQPPPPQNNTLNEAGAPTVPPQNMLGNAPQFGLQNSEQREKSNLILAKQANDKQVSNPMRTRAESATAMDKFLVENQPEFSQRIQNAAEYAGIIGKGKKAADAMKSESPQKYLDYQWFKTDFVSQMSNQIKQMERLTGDQEQRKELRNTWLKATEGMDIDPKGAVKLINQTISTMGKLGNTVISQAEPNYKGVYLKEQGIPENWYQKDYISTGEKSPNSQLSTIPDDVLAKIAGGQ